MTKSIKYKLSKLKSKNPMWKGDNVGYNALHAWVKRNLIKPQVCSNCNQTKALDLANISQEYKRDLSDWEWLCRKCHMEKDGRINQLSRPTKISLQQAKEIMNQRGILGSKELSEKYGISRDHIRHIWTGSRWKSMEHCK